MDTLASEMIRELRRRYHIAAAACAALAMIAVFLAGRTLLKGENDEPEDRVCRGRVR